MPLCPSCNKRASEFESAGEFEMFMALDAKEVDWNKHPGEEVLGCPECAIGWRPA